MKALYEKISIYGAAALTERELLAILIDDMGVAERLLDHYALTALPVEDISRLRMAEGLGLQRAAKVAAAVEFSRRRAISDSDSFNRILSSDDAVKILRPIFDGVKHEECWVLFLTSSARVMERLKISQGGVQATVVDNKLIVKRALELLAPQILIAHNHPSGSAEPSQADITLTARIRSAAELFDIKLLDHIIITSSSHYSFRSHNLL